MTLWMVWCLFDVDGFGLLLSFGFVFCEPLVGIANVRSSHLEQICWSSSWSRLFVLKLVPKIVPCFVPGFSDAHT